MTDTSFGGGAAMLPRTRIQWIDVAKLIGIYLVILGHISLTYNPLIWFIYSFHMPLFFFLSGLTAKKESVYDTFKKSVRSLLIPYVCLYLILYLVLIVDGNFLRPEKLDDGLLKPFLGLLVGVGFDTDISTNNCVPLWFLPGLFCCKMLFSIIHNIGGKNENAVQIGCSILFAAVAYCLRTNDLFLPFSLGSALLAYPFFVVGNMVSPKVNSILTDERNAKQNVIFVAIMLVALAVDVLLTLINGRVDVNHINFGDNIFLFYVAAIVGIAFIALLSSFIKLNGFWNVLAQNTIVILAFHGKANKLIITLLTKLGIVDVVDEKAVLPVAIAVVVALGSLLLNYIPVVIINKYFPWVIGRKKRS